MLDVGIHGTGYLVIWLSAHRDGIGILGCESVSSESQDGQSGLPGIGVIVAKGIDPSRAIAMVKKRIVALVERMLGCGAAFLEVKRRNGLCQWCGEICRFIFEQYENLQEI